MDLRIDYVRPNELRPAEYNPRTISDATLKALATLMDEHGFVDPVIARREDGLILGGHQRIRANALRRRPDERVPCVFISDVDDTRAKALNVSLNNPEAQGQFDDEMLAELINDIHSADLDAVALTGFSAESLDDLMCLLDQFAPTEDLDELAESADATTEASEHDVMVIFEMPRDLYIKAKEDIDTLISKYDLPCYLRSI